MCIRDSIYIEWMFFNLYIFFDVFNDDDGDDNDSDSDDGQTMNN